MIKSKMTNVDFYLSNSIKSYRTMFGLTQSQLANKLNITTQQLNKYENGIDRVSISMLVNLSKIFKCDIKDMLPEENDDILKNNVLQVSENGEIYKVKKKTLNKKKVVELLKLFFQMTNEKQDILLKKIKDSLNKQISY